MALHLSYRQHRSCSHSALASTVLAGVVLVCVALCVAPVISAEKEADKDPAITIADVSVFASNVTEAVAMYTYEEKNSLGYENSQMPLWMYALIPPGASDSDPKCDYPSRLQQFMETGAEISPLLQTGVLQLVDEKTATGSQLEEQNKLFTKYFSNVTMPSVDEMGCMGLLTVNMNWEFKDTHARVMKNVTDEETGETFLTTRVERVRENPQVFWTTDPAALIDAETIMDVAASRSIFRGATLASQDEVVSFVRQSHHHATSAVIAYLNTTHVMGEMKKVGSAKELSPTLQLQAFNGALMAMFSNLSISKFYYSLAIADASLYSEPLEDKTGIVVYRPVKKGTLFSWTISIVTAYMVLYV